MTTARTGIVVWFATLDADRVRAIEDAWRLRFGVAGPGAPATSGAARPGDDHEREVAYRLLRLMLPAALANAAATLPLSRSPAGKPRIEGSGVEFSLSRSSDILAIAVSASGSVGIDVERRRRIKAALHRRQQIIAAGELIAPDRRLPGNPEDPDGRYLHAWVRLEALAKATGEGIGGLLTRLGIIGGGKPGSDSLQGQWCIEDLAVGDGLFAALATPVSGEPVTVRWLPSDSRSIVACLQG